MIHFSTRLLLFFFVLNTTALQAAPADSLWLHRAATNACPRPELLQAKSATDSTATLTWTDVADVYEIEIQPDGFPMSGIPTYTINVDPPFEVSGLTPGQAYRFAVRAVCNDTLKSTWSVPRAFATDLNNKRPCPLSFDLLDTTCVSGSQFFNIHVDDAPGAALGADVLLSAVRLMIEHPWRSDLQAWLWAPDSTRVQLIGGLNAGDRNLGDPSAAPCAQYVELTESAGAQPLSAAAERDNVIGAFLPVQSLAALSNGQNPNGVWRLEICDNKANDRGMLRLFGLVFARASCPAADSAWVSDVTESSAKVWWTPGTSGDSILIEYGPAGFYPGAAGTGGLGSTIRRLALPATQPLQLSGLVARQTYEVYVRRQCAPGEWSPNTRVIRFFTNCLPTLQETADDQAICPTGCADPCPMTGVWQNISGDDFEWKIRTGPGQSYPIAGPPSSPDGSGNYFFFRNNCSFSGANGKTAVLRSQCIQVVIPPDAPCQFSFDLYMFTKIGQMSILAFQISTDGGINWTTLQTWSGNRGKRWRREYVNLQGYNGQTAVFQLVATGTFGAYGDIALDNLTFYGSTSLGPPAFTYYRDQDGDGYGNANVKLTSCLPAVPTGYVTNSGDCNDNAAGIFPGAPEILCNKTDENCNGDADDGFIPPPAANGTSVCSGSNAVLQAQGAPKGQFYWFNQPVGGVLLGAGATLTLPAVTQSQIVYLADSIPGGACSSARVAVNITVNPTPVLTQTAAPAICLGQSFNLAGLTVNDQAGTSGALSIHSGWPANAGNQLASPVVSPTTTTTYYFVKTTAFNCSDSAAVTLTVRRLPSVQITNGDTVLVCRNRSVTLNAQAGGPALPPYTYAWSNGLNFASIPVTAGNLPGAVLNFAVTVTAANGCTATDQVAVRSYNNVTQASIVSVQNPVTCGGNNGNIKLQPLDGTPPYQIQWSGPVSGTLFNVTGQATISGLLQGGYRITVTDATNACALVLPQIVLNAPGLQVSVDTIVHPSCPGQSAGSISLNVSGTNPTYLWNNNQTAATASNLAPGVYSVTITDGNCQQVLSNLEITAPPPIDIKLNALDTVRCHGGADGAIRLAVFGATPPYQYDWSNGGDGATQEFLEADSYTVTITDANGCTFVPPAYTVPEPQPLTVAADSIRPVRCFGESNGFVRLTINGGNLPYSIAWNNGAAGPNNEAIPAATYTAVVTDAKGCTASGTYIVTQPTLLAISLLQAQDPTCRGAQNGLIEIAAQGGIAPYQYLWNTGLAADTLPVLAGRRSGTYQATVTDAAGCSATLAPVQLNAPQLLSIALDSLRNVGCHGEASGVIAISVGGAELPLAATWNGILDGLLLDQAPAGIYIVEVTDARQCRLRDTFDIRQPQAPLSLSLLDVTNVRCHGEPSGGIEVRTIGGTAPYTFIWSNGSPEEDLFGIPAGVYQLTASDANGCTATLAPVTLTEPPVLLAEADVENIPCFGVPYGSIQIDVNGGIPPYTYFWSTGDTLPGLLPLPAGAYDVTVLDAAGCEEIMTGITVIDLLSTFQVAAQDVQAVSCSGEADGRLIVRVNNGTPPFQFAWSPPVGLHPNIMSPSDQAVNLAGGAYQVTVTDAQGCYAVSEVLFVEEAPPLQVGVNGVTNVLCHGDSTGAIKTTLSGGLPAYTFLWSNGSTASAPGMLPAGVYTLTVTDFRDCSAVSAPIIIEQPDHPLSVTLDTVLNDRCGLGDGAILLQVEGGTPPNEYLWSSGQQSASITGLSAGNYQLGVTDLAGCTLVSPVFQVQTQAAPIALMQPVNLIPPACFGDSTGLIGVQAGGGTPPFQYFWSHGASGAVASGLPAGQYALTVSDGAQCTNTFSFSLTQPPALNIEVQTDSLANGWQITLDISGGAMPYAVLWDAAAGSQTGPVASGLASGWYAYTLTDGNDCTMVDSVAVGTVSTGAAAPVRQVAVWPNPATTQLWARIELTHAGEASIRLFNAQGMLIYTEMRDGAPEHLFVADVQALPPGLYILEVRAGGHGIVRAPVLKL